MPKQNSIQELVQDRKIVSTLFIGVNILAFLFGWAMRRDIGVAFAFNTASVATSPWQMLTYSFVPTFDLIGVIFSSMWIWNIGTSVERDLGSKRYLLVLFLYSVLAALCLWAGSMITGFPGVLAGTWGLLSCITVLWGTRYPELTTLFMFVIPIKAKWLALLSLGLVFFGSHPALAVFAALPLILAALFARDQLPIKYGTGSSYAMRATKTRSGMSTSPEFIEDVRKREQERADRERLRKLFEGGMIDNTKDKEA
jgi:membrane associated rhomboid family serine protease